MPRKYYKKRSKRTYRKSRPTVVSTVGTGISPYPKTFKAKLRYAFSKEINPVGTTGKCLLIRANDLYDPEYEVGGGQPRGFDEMMNAYDHFTVLSSKITVLWSSTSGTDTILSGIYVTDNNTFVLNNQELMERPGSLFRQTGGSQSTSHKISRSFSTSKFFSRTKSSLLADDQLRGSATSTPNEMAYYGIYFNAADGNDDLAAIKMQIIVDYVAVFHEPSQISAS